MKDERGPWYLITGFILGVGLGLLYSWVISPLEYVDTAPSSLRADFKDRYRVLIAEAYAANGDMNRAQARLALLADEDVNRALAIQAQQTMAEGNFPEEARALGLLAAALGRLPTAPFVMAVVSPTPYFTISPSTTPENTPTVTPSPVIKIVPTHTPTFTQLPELSLTPTQTATPKPSPTPTPTLGAPFVVKDKVVLCDPGLGAPLIQVWVEDVDGKPIPGVEIVIYWVEGEEHFFTGLKPEIGWGYADVLIQAGVDYTLQIASGGEPVSALVAQECTTAGGNRYWGSWNIVFAQP
ncbi:MAG: hypothetical protein AB1345_10020 [Chloroflexota bacterium]